MENERERENEKKKKKKVFALNRLCKSWILEFSGFEKMTITKMTGKSLGNGWLCFLLLA